jgi:hypothetical protein
MPVMAECKTLRGHILDRQTNLLLAKGKTTPAVGFRYNQPAISQICDEFFQLFLGLCA